MNLDQAHQILELPLVTSQDNIKKKYKQLVLRYHPDRNKSSDATKKFIEIQEAYKFLRKTPTEQTKTNFKQRYHDPYENTDWQQFFRNMKKTTSTSSTTWTFTFD